MMSGGGLDPDAVSFLTAAGITDATITTAIDFLVKNLKSYGIWTKLKAIYPFVGGTATTHKFNLKNPVDSDAAFRLLFSGGWTHSANGALPNGTNAFANTFLNADTNLIVNSSHISYYSRKLTVGSEVEIGAFQNSSNLLFQLRAATNYISGTTTIILNFTTTSDARGFWLGTRRASNDREIYRNGISEATSTISDANNNPNLPIYIGARSLQGSGFDFPSSKECAFASIGDGLTDTEAANFYTAVQAFQTTLGRQV